MNFEEVDKTKVGSWVRAISFSLGKSSNDETCKEQTLCDWFKSKGLNHFEKGLFFSIIEGLGMFIVDASTSSWMDAEPCLNFWPLELLFFFHPS